MSIATYVSSPFSKWRLPSALQAENHASRLYTKKKYFHIFWIQECILFDRASFMQHTSACSVRDSIWSGCVGEGETSDNRHRGLEAIWLLAAGVGEGLPEAFIQSQRQIK